LRRNVEKSACEIRQTGVKVTTKPDRQTVTIQIQTNIFSTPSPYIACAKYAEKAEDVKDESRKEKKNIFFEKHTK
jgi:hypothetical protein